MKNSKRGNFGEKCVQSDNVSSKTLFPNWKGLFFKTSETSWTLKRTEKMTAGPNLQKKSTKFPQFWKTRKKSEIQLTLDYLLHSSLWVAFFQILELHASRDVFIQHIQIMEGKTTIQLVRVLNRNLPLRFTFHWRSLIFRLKFWNPTNLPPDT